MQRHPEERGQVVLLKAGGYPRAYLVKVKVVKKGRFRLRTGRDGPGVQNADHRHGKLTSTSTESVTR
jgi:hypothetical protein